MTDQVVRTAFCNRGQFGLSRVPINIPGLVQFQQTILKTRLGLNLGDLWLDQGVLNYLYNKHKSTCKDALYGF